MVQKLKIISVSNISLNEKNIGGLLMNKNNVKVEIKVQLECKEDQNQNSEKMIELYFSGNEKYSLEIIGSYSNTNNDVELYLVMNTTGSYEDNLDRLRELHFKLEELLESKSVKYKGMSLIPNKVNWN